MGLELDCGFQAIFMPDCYFSGFAPASWCFLLVVLKSSNRLVAFVK